MKKKNKFIIYAIILIIIKQILASQIPIFAIGGSSCDDQLMIKLETSLLQLDWLGEFNSLTFVKGMFFPFFLAINAFLGISYINAVTLLYSLSCLLFVYSIKNLFQKQTPLFIIFTVLLFNPIMYDTQVIQRVYRNSLTPSQVLLIFSSIFYIFINRKKENNKLWFWSILCGLTLATFWNTREDAVWILPLLIVFITIMITEYLRYNKDNWKLQKIILFLLPFVILFSSNFFISMVNYSKYGVYTRVDVSSSSFAEAMKAIYSVPPNEKILYTSVTREKLERIYEISPSLKSIKEEIKTFSLTMDEYGRNNKDEEIEDGWFWWVLRFAAEANGYYETPQKAEKFFKNITKEIKTAQKKGLLEKQAIMPSALMSPWRKGYTKQLFDTMVKIILFTNQYKEVKANTIESIGTYEQIKLFEITTNDKAIMPNFSSHIKGWYLNRNIDYSIHATNIDTNQIYQTIFCKKNEPCTIDLINLEDLEKVSLEIYNSSNDKIESLNLRDNLTSDSNEFRSYYIHNYSTINVENYQKKFKIFISVN